MLKYAETKLLHPVLRLEEQLLQLYLHYFFSLLNVLRWCWWWYLHLTSGHDCRPNTDLYTYLTCISISGGTLAVSQNPHIRECNSTCWADILGGRTHSLSCNRQLFANGFYFNAGLIFSIRICTRHSHGEWSHSNSVYVVVLYVYLVNFHITFTLKWESTFISLGVGFYERFLKAPVISRRHTWADKRAAAGDANDRSYTHKTSLKMIVWRLLEAWNEKQATLFVFSGVMLVGTCRFQVSSASRLSVETPLTCVN